MEHWVNPPLLTFDEVTPKLTRFHIWLHVATAYTFGVHQFWVKVVDYSDATGYSTIQSSYLRHLVSGLVFLYPDVRSFYGQYSRRGRETN
jgi:hypothetical protein